MKRGRAEPRAKRITIALDDATMAGLDREATRRGWTLSGTAAALLKGALAALRKGGAR